MAFGNKGGGSRTGPKYPQQVTVGVTDEHLKFLKSRSIISLADALRDCIEACMKKEPGAAGELAGPSLTGERIGAPGGGTPISPRDAVISCEG